MRRAAILAWLALAPSAMPALAGEFSSAVSRWLDPATAPFLPVPEIDVDPNSGTTLGIIPVRLRTDEQGSIRRIVAPDLIYNPYFGFGARGRWFGFPSDDVQWSLVGGGKERVEREFDAVYESGRLRQRPWSYRLEAVFDRSGTPRFYGIGNHSPAISQTNYTEQQAYAQGVLARNLNRIWQLAYTLRLRTVDVTPGSLAGIATIGSRFGRILGTGVNNEILNRLALGFDTRDDPAIPSHGQQIELYSGLASRRGVLNASLYREYGLDARGYWPIGTRCVFVAHVALRYLPVTTRTPFWALSSVGGDASVLGGVQPLRGFGDSRFYDRNAFAANFELRLRPITTRIGNTSVDIELAPFVDLARVFARAGTSPLSQLHKVGGLGVRAIARPTVVGYVDIGYGTEGTAVFTGINYPF